MAALSVETNYFFYTGIIPGLRFSVCQAVYDDLTKHTFFFWEMHLASTKYKQKVLQLHFDTYCTLVVQMINNKITIKQQTHSDTGALEAQGQLPVLSGC